jgi:hypothetical protein
MIVLDEWRVDSVLAKVTRIENLREKTPVIGEFPKRNQFHIGNSERRDIRHAQIKAPPGRTIAAEIAAERGAPLIRSFTRKFSRVGRDCRVDIVLRERIDSVAETDRIFDLDVLRKKMRKRGAGRSGGTGGRAPRPHRGQVRPRSERTQADVHHQPHDAGEPEAECKGWDDEVL